MDVLYATLYSCQNKSFATLSLDLKMKNINTIYSLVNFNFLSIEIELTHFQLIEELLIMLGNINAGFSTKRTIINGKVLNADAGK